MRKQIFEFINTHLVIGLCLFCIPFSVPIGCWLMGQVQTDTKTTLQREASQCQALQSRTSQIDTITDQAARTGNTGR